MSNRVMPLVASCVFRSLALLPLCVLQTLGQGAGWIAWLVAGSFKRRSNENFLRAFPQATLQMQRAAMLSVGQMFLEMPYWWVRRNDRALNRTVAPADWHLFEQALAEGKGVILLSPHMGCFEITAQAYALRFGHGGPPMTVLFRPPRQAWLRSLVGGARQRPGLLTAPTTLSGVKQMIKALKAGEAVGLLPDQVPPQGMGLMAPFFGRQAYTMTLSVRLVQQTGATVLLAWGERLAWGRGYRVHVQPMRETLSPDLPTAVAQVNRAMEELIMQCPGQYLWGYARYKQARESL